jgi:hypothetical protein
MFLPIHDTLHDGMLIKKDGPTMLKSYLEIKRQLAYCKKNALEAKAKDNEAAYDSWRHMVEAYSIALQIMEGKEL